MKVIIFKDACGLECAMKEDEFVYYDKAIDNERDEDAIRFFEENYPEYCDFVEIPEDATDYSIIDDEDSDTIRVMIVRNNKMECIYCKRFW